MDDKKQPIIIKKIKKGGHGAHGGAWKVAYADFVTAMMAFFLLMWMLGGTSHLTREGIAQYFKNPSGIQGPGGASTSMIKLGGALEIPHSNMMRKSIHEQKNHSFKNNTQPHTQKNKPEQAETQKSVVSEQERLQDKRRLDTLLQKLRTAIQQSQALRPFKDQLLLDVTPQGLRIQIVDKKNRPMFDSSSAILKSYTKLILHKIAKIINTVPNRISIAGHTDATPFATRYIYVEYGSFEERRAYTNWELSADRANAARRELIIGGMRKNKVAEVIGLADSVLFDKANPYDPINRRISIVVLNKETEAAIGVLTGKGGVEPKDVPKELNKTKAKSKS